MAEKTYIVIPTRGRSLTGYSFKQFNNLEHEIILMINKNEVQDYRKAGFKNEIWEHDDNYGPTIRNAILNRVGNGNNVITFDDDIKSFGKFIPEGKKNKQINIGINLFLQILKNGFERFPKSVKLFGVSPTTNPLFFNPKTLISSNVFINGAVQCIRVTDGIRYDEALPVKCDYGFAAEFIRNGFHVARFNYLYADNDFDKMDGGRKYYSKGDTDRMLSFEYLLRKYPKYFKPNPKRQYELIMKVGK